MGPQADRASDDGASAGLGGSQGTAAGGSASITTSTGTSNGGTVLPPETEKEPTYTLPVRSGRWVWSANPESGKVAVIDTRTLDVKLTSAGFAPTYLAPLKIDGDVESAAIVANARSNDATLMRRVGDQMTRTTVPTHVGVNAWAVSTSGRWAIAWSNSAQVKMPDPSESFQDITIVDTASDPPVATRLSVGYRPSRIFFQNDEARAFIVSSAGVTIVELGGASPSVSRDVSLSDAPNETPVDVSVVPDGSYALFRVEGSPRVSLVEFATGKRTDVTLAGAVTDLDLVADGTTAIAVVRGQPINTGGSGGSTNTGGSGGSTNTGGSGGSTNSGGSGGSTNTGGSGGTAGGGNLGGGGNAGGVGGADADAGAGASGSAGGSGGSEMDNAAPAAGGALAGGAGGVPDAGGAGDSSDPVPPASGYTPSQVALLDVLAAAKNPKRFESILLKDLVGSVAVSEASAMAVLYTTAGGLDRVTVLNTSPDSSEYLQPSTAHVYAPVDAVFIAPDTEHALVTLRVTPGSTIGGAFGVVPLRQPQLTNIETTDAPITAVAFAPSPTTSAILTAATGTTAYLVHMPTLRVDSVRLPSLPLASGIVPNEAGYVVQKHPEGRLSLINLETAETRTLTGFELSGGIDNGK